MLWCVALFSVPITGHKGPGKFDGWDEEEDEGAGAHDDDIEEVRTEWFTVHTWCCITSLIGKHSGAWRHFTAV